MVRGQKKSSPEFLLAVCGHGLPTVWVLPFQIKTGNSKIIVNEFCFIVNDIVRCVKKECTICPGVHERGVRPTFLGRRLPRGLGPPSWGGGYLEC